MCFAHSLVFILYIVVKVTMNMAEYAISQRSGQPKNVNFELIIRGLKYDVFDWDQMKHHKGCGQE